MRLALLLALALTVLASDQLGKAWAVLHLTSAGSDGTLSALLQQRNLEARRTAPVVLIPEHLQLRYVENPGAAWGTLGRTDVRVRVPLFYLVSVLAVAFILVFHRHLAREQLVLRLAMGLTLGGALGNFSDRLLRGYVIDFLDLHWGATHWPTFNVADVGITAGVVLMLADTLLQPRSPRPAPADPDLEPPQKSALTEEGWEPFP